MDLLSFLGISLCFFPLHCEGLSRYSIRRNTHTQPQREKGREREQLLVDNSLPTADLEARTLFHPFRYMYQAHMYNRSSYYRIRREPNKCSLSLTSALSSLSHHFSYTVNSLCVCAKQRKKFKTVYIAFSFFSSSKLTKPTTHSACTPRRIFLTHYCTGCFISYI